MESPLKCTLPLVICIYNINSYVNYLGCFTQVRCDMSSISKKSTRVVAAFRKDAFLILLPEAGAVVVVEGAGMVLNSDKKASFKIGPLVF